MQAILEGLCSPGANGPSGMPPVDEQPEGRLLTKGGAPLLTVGEQGGQLAALLLVGEQGRGSKLPCSPSASKGWQRAGLGAARRGRAAFTRGCSPGVSASLLTMMGSHGGCLSSVSTLCLLGLSSSLGSHLPRASDSCPRRGSGSFASFWEPSSGDVRLLHTAELAWMVDTWSVGQGV